MVSAVELIIVVLLSLLYAHALITSDDKYNDDNNKKIEDYSSDIEDLWDDYKTRTSNKKNG